MRICFAERAALTDVSHDPMWEQFVFSDDYCRGLRERFPSPLDFPVDRKRTTRRSIPNGVLGVDTSGASATTTALRVSGKRRKTETTKQAQSVDTAQGEEGRFEQEPIAEGGPGFGTRATDGATMLHKEHETHGPSPRGEHSAHQLASLVLRQHWKSWRTGTQSSDHTAVLREGLALKIRDIHIAPLRLPGPPHVRITLDVQLSESYSHSSEAVYLVQG